MSCVAINTTNLYASINELVLMGERFEEIARNSKINVFAYRSSIDPSSIGIPRTADSSLAFGAGASVGTGGVAISFSVTPSERINFEAADSSTPQALQAMFDAINDAGNTLNNTVACGTPGATNLDSGVINAYKARLADAMNTLNFYISSPLWGLLMSFGLPWVDRRPVDIPSNTFWMDASRLPQLREFRDRARPAYRTLLAAGSILSATPNPEPPPPPTEPPGTDPAKCDEIIEAINNLQIDISVIVNPILAAINQISCDLTPVIEKVEEEHNSTRETIATQHSSTRETIATQHNSTRETIATQHNSTRETIATQHNSTRETIATEHTATKEIINAVGTNLENRAIEILTRIHETRVELREVREDVKILLTCPCSQPIIDEIRQCCAALELEFDNFSIDFTGVENYVANLHNETQILIGSQHNDTRTTIENTELDIKNHVTNEHGLTRNLIIGDVNSNINVRHTQTQNHITNQHNETQSLITNQHNQTRNHITTRHNEIHNHVTNQHSETRIRIDTRHNETRTILIDEIRRCCERLEIEWPDIAGSHEMPACESPQDDPVWRDYLRAIAAGIGGQLAGEILGKYIPGELDDTIISAITGELVAFAVDQLFAMFDRFFSDRLQSETYQWSGTGLVGLSEQVKAVQQQLNTMAAELCFDPAKDVQQQTGDICTPLVVLPPDGDERFILTSQLQITFAEQGAIYTQHTPTWRITIPQPIEEIDWCQDIAPLVWQRGAEVYGRLRFSAGNIAWTAGYFGAPGFPNPDLAEDVARAFLSQVARLSQADALPIRVTKGITPRRPPRRIIVEPIRAAVLLVDEGGNKRRVYCLKPPAGGC